MEVALDERQVLHPRSNEDEESEDDAGIDSDPDLAQLRELGLVKSDIAFPNWCALNDEGYAPGFIGESPVAAARYYTRDLRGEHCDLNFEQGLLTLASFFCSGRVPTPWELGLAPADFKDSFDDDMPHADAFRLYTMSAFDDAEHLSRTIQSDDAPAEWKPFTERELAFYS